MLLLKARNVMEAWDLFRGLMSEQTWRVNNLREISPRGTQTLEIREPVCTTYLVPTERVLLDPVRDANPFFHLYEALWILNGCNDVRRVAYYSENIRQFSDNGVTFNGAYGERLRSYFGVDQIEELVSLLQRDPDSRRGVLQMWEPVDLITNKKDHPCNTSIYVKIRDGELHITVSNRSNDAVWGCYGANAVQFSVLQEYLATRLKVKVGTYRQVSDSLHVYLDGDPGKVWHRIESAGMPNMRQNYAYSSMGLTKIPMILDIYQFKKELEILLYDPSGVVDKRLRFKEPWMANVVHPLLSAFTTYKCGEYEEAIYELSMSFGRFNDAWLLAGRDWIERRLWKREGVARAIA